MSDLTYSYHYRNSIFGDSLLKQSNLNFHVFTKTQQAKFAGYEGLDPEAGYSYFPLDYPYSSIDYYEDSFISSPMPNNYDRLPGLGDLILLDGTPALEATDVDSFFDSAVIQWDIASL